MYKYIYVSTTKQSRIPFTSMGVRLIFKYVNTNVGLRSFRTANHCKLILLRNLLQFS